MPSLYDHARIGASSVSPLLFSCVPASDTERAAPLATRKHSSVILKKKGYNEGKMKRRSTGLGKIIHLSLAGLLLMGVLIPLPTAHAMSTARDHGGMPSVPRCCPTPPAPAVLKDREGTLAEDKDESPEPSPQTPFYAQFYSFTEPLVPSENYIGGSRTMRPPDLVKLYSNYRF